MYGLLTLMPNRRPILPKQAGVPEKRHVFATEEIARQLRELPVAPLAFWIPRLDRVAPIAMVSGHLRRRVPVDARMLLDVDQEPVECFAFCLILSRIEKMDKPASCVYALLDSGDLLSLAPPVTR